jgi:hypothetical protein
LSSVWKSSPSKVFFTQVSISAKFNSRPVATFLEQVFVMRLWHT